MRLSVVFSEEYEKWEKKANETYLSISDEMEKYPQAVANSVSGLSDLQRGYQSVSGRRSEVRPAGADWLLGICHWEQG